jgi:hypothetical protein
VTTTTKSCEKVKTLVVIPSYLKGKKKQCGSGEGQPVSFGEGERTPPAVETRTPAEEVGRKNTYKNGYVGRW